MSTLKVGNISNVGGTKSSTTDNLIDARCKAWCNFTGDTDLVNASFNVSSITDTGSALYTVNFTSALASVNYVCAGNASWSINGANGTFITCDTKTVNGFRVVTVDAGSNSERATVDVMVFG